MVVANARQGSGGVEISSFRSEVFGSLLRQLETAEKGRYGSTPNAVRYGLGLPFPDRTGRFFPHAVIENRRVANKPVIIQPQFNPTGVNLNATGVIREAYDAFVIMVSPVPRFELERRAKADLTEFIDLYWESPRSSGHSVNPDDLRAFLKMAEASPYSPLEEFSERSRRILLQKAVQELLESRQPHETIAARMYKRIFANEVQKYQRVHSGDPDVRFSPLTLRVPSLGIALTPDIVFPELSINGRGVVIAAQAELKTPEHLRVLKKASRAFHLHLILATQASREELEGRLSMNVLDFVGDYWQVTPRSSYKLQVTLNRMISSSSAYVGDMLSDMRDRMHSYYRSWASTHYAHRRRQPKDKSNLREYMLSSDA
jgi:hypothetical protein